MKYNLILDVPQKTEPLQLSRCKICKVFLVRGNYQDHLLTVAHQIGILYSNSNKIEINETLSDGCTMSYRLNSPRAESLVNSFFCSVKSEFLLLIQRVITFPSSLLFSVTFKLLTVYDLKRFKNKPNKLGEAKAFTINKKVI